MKKLVVVIVLMLLAAQVNFTFAQEPAIMMSNKPGWHKIGEVKASFDMENESISVLGADKFKSILLKVTDAPIDIERIQVFYESGDMEEIEIDSQLKAGTETRVIGVKPSEELKKVVFTYKTLPNRKDEKAHVELYGLK